MVVRSRRLKWVEHAERMEGMTCENLRWDTLERREYLKVIDVDEL
jgi:hypothetical protein